MRNMHECFTCRLASRTLAFVAQVKTSTHAHRAHLTASKLRYEFAVLERLEAASIAPEPSITPSPPRRFVPQLISLLDDRLAIIMRG